MAAKISHCTEITNDIHDLKESCRVCMNRNTQMRPLFEVTKSIVDKIHFCTGVMLKHEYGCSERICRACLRNLSIAHKFKKTCLKSEENLQKRVTEKVKEEVIESNDDTNGPCTDNIIQYYDINNDSLCENIEKKELHNLIDIDKVKDDSLNSSYEGSKEGNSPVQTYKETKPNIVQPNKAKVRMKKYKFRKLYCETCEIKFESKKESDEHRNTVHQEKAGWVCEICGKNFVHRASLHTHVRSHMPPQHACATCGYRTNNKYDLIKHLRIHDADGKMYKCSLCAQAYRTVSNLREHARRRHELVRRFPCTRAGCGKAFHDRSKLNRHIDSHDEVKRYICDVCHSAFTRRCYWKKHLQRQHNIEVPPARPGRQKENFLVRDFPQNEKNVIT